MEPSQETTARHDLPPEGSFFGNLLATYLAALYDQSTGEPIEKRWSRLRRRSGFRPLWSRRDLQIGFGTTLVVIGLIAMFPALRTMAIMPWLLLPILLAWLYWGWRLARAEWFASDIRKGLKVLSRDSAALRWELLWFKPSELGGQPMPTASGTGGEERYELLRKFQGVLKPLGDSTGTERILDAGALLCRYIALDK